MKKIGMLLYATSAIALCSALQAQVAPLPARLAIEGPKDVIQGQPGKFNIKLVDMQGHAIKSTVDMKFSVNAPGSQVDRETVVIPKGASSTELVVSKQTAGLTNIHLEQADTPAGGLTASTQIGLVSDQSYTPVPPLSLWVNVQPGAKLKVQEAAKIIVRQMDSRRFTVPAQGDIKVAFPGLGNALSPGQISISRGELYAEADLTESQPQVVTLNPISSPPMSIHIETSSIEFMSPIAGLRLISDPSYVRAVRHPKTTVKIGLVDGQGNWIASDKDRTIVLQLDPPSAGTLSRSDVTIPRGQSVVEAVFTATKEGKATIKAINGEGFSIQNADIEFYYAAVYFWLIAALGGLIGGGVRNALGTDHKLKTIAIHVGGGMLVGIIVYLVAPLLVALSLKPAGLESGSKIFESFIWGVTGGGSGVTLLGRLFSH